VVVLDADQRIEDCNRLALDWLFDGAELDTLTGRLASECCDNAPRLLPIVSLGDRTVQTVHAFGRDLQVVATGVDDERGQRLKTVVLFSDITQQKQGERRLQLYGQVFSHVGEGILITDADNRIIEVNDAFERITGYSRDELIGKVRLRDLLTPASQQVFAHRFPVFLQQGHLQNVDLEIVCKNGSVLPVRVNATAMTDAQGRFIMSRSVVYDRTEPQKAERNQARLNRALQLLSRCNMALVHSTDENTLLQAICRLVVEDGGYRMAWIGYAQDDAEQSVRPVAQHGFDDDYLRTAAITWADTDRGRGPPVRRFAKD